MKLHLIAICGTGMGSLAGLLKAAGHEVRGADENVYPPMSTQLAEQGIQAYPGFHAANLDWGPDRVVVGNVCRRDHVEVVAARERGLDLTSFPAVLADLFLAGRHSLVVAGTHGKTTTAALASFVLADAGRDPSFLIGGVPLDFGRGWHLGQGEAFVVEGDEYDTAFFDKGSKFFHYRPRTAILTSVEFDHADIFPDLAAVKAAFAKFVGLIPVDGLLVVAHSSPEALAVARSARCRVVTYGLDPRSGADYTAELVPGAPAGRQLFEVRRRGEALCLFETGLCGRHNLENVLGVIAAMQGVGLDAAEIARGVRRFAGVKRRQEVRGVAQGVTVIDDFAHHPTAVRLTLQGLRARYGRARLVAVFEPRSATSRRQVFQREWAESFVDADEVLLAPLHAPERVPAAERLDVEQLVRDLRARGCAARVLPTVAEMVEHLAGLAPGEVVVVMSSGGFGGLLEKLLARLGDAVEPAVHADLPGIRHLLGRLQLPDDGVEEHLRDFLVIRDAQRRHVIATAGVELYDDAGLLRSLAVVPERRGQGLGWMLADHALQRAAARGARRLYLLTESASDFFAKRCGFQPIDRSEVEPAVQASLEFSLHCCAGATCMRLVLK
ncbi:MAG: UDP-N-acetylmuramate:L-alanyl-gamma-D-glutamyl-meso-diaminopimelate ligase [Deltaproteobacteria bacterium]|nr:UDP-N-acetylmuramate:L-alanyl-gamma-D-glutamyl-meso-diaminopimelate ligase [Deltaproteobacteria bacterium]